MIKLRIPSFWLLFLLTGFLSRCHVLEMRATSAPMPIPTTSLPTRTATALPAGQVTGKIAEPSPTSPPQEPVKATPLSPNAIQPSDQPVLADPTGALIALRKPLLIDGEQGRIYASGQVNGQPRTVVLSTIDGRPLAVFETVGELALDRIHNRLMVDNPQSGLSILDAQTGAVLTTQYLPSHDRIVQPQISPDGGTVYAFRSTDVYLVNSMSLSMEKVAVGEPTTSCGDPAGSAAPYQSQYDLVHQRLYLSFITATCTPWATTTIVGYDAVSMAPFARFATDPHYQSEPFHGSLFGSTSPRMGPTQFWAWNSQEPWHNAGAEENLSLNGIAADWERGLIYEGIAGEIRVVDSTTRQIIGSKAVALLAEGELVGHDPISDQLYFLTGSGRLHVWPAVNLFDGQDIPPEPAPAALPARPVLRLVVSPGWPADPTLVGLWDNGDCPVDGGQIFVQRRDGNWEAAPLNSDGSCDAVADIALSPNYPQDHTLFAAANDLSTVLKSTDGGRSWLAAETAFPANHHFKALYISANYAQDQTVFAHLVAGTIFRSQDGGRTWQELHWSFDQLAISMEYVQDDQTLMGAVGSELYRSQDGGDTWHLVGNTPENSSLVMLSMAPLFAKWQVLFAYSTTGTLFRSLDGGISWEYRLATAASEKVQIVYAPDLEMNRPIFLLTGRSLENSYDGWESTWGVWPRFEVHPAHIATLAISPNYLYDHLLLVGTADGQVLTGDASPPSLDP